MQGKLERNKDGDAIAYFGDACRACPLRGQWTNARNGRTMHVSRHERRLGHRNGEPRQSLGQRNDDWPLQISSSDPAKTTIDHSRGRVATSTMTCR